MTLSILASSFLSYFNKLSVTISLQAF